MVEAASLIPGLDDICFVDWWGHKIISHQRTYGSYLEANCKFIQMLLFRPWTLMFPSEIFIVWSLRIQEIGRFDEELIIGHWIYEQKRNITKSAGRSQPSLSKPGKWKTVLCVKYPLSRFGKNRASVFLISKTDSERKLATSRTFRDLYLHNQLCSKRFWLVIMM